MKTERDIDPKIYSTGELSWYSRRRGLCVHNDSCLNQDSDSETEERIARAVEKAYHDGFERGFQRGAETLEQKLGA